MRRLDVKKLARVLRVLVILAFVCNLVTLFFVPGLALMRGLSEIEKLTPYENPLELPARLLAVFALCWTPTFWILSEDSYAAVLAVFLLFCGVSTAVILWQGKRVLSTIIKGNPFTPQNADSLKIASVCCFLISCAALIRMVWGFFYYRSVRPLVTYNALFVPVFFMAGLLCMVMSALFRQAAELKEENDLTI